MKNKILLLIACATSACASLPSAPEGNGNGNGKYPGHPNWVSVLDTFPADAPIVRWWNAGNPKRPANAYVWILLQSGDGVVKDTVFLEQDKSGDSAHVAALARLSQYRP